ncbi:MAG TPA: CHAT domain-containing protein [Kofleriaceae bacterium]
MTLTLELARAAKAESAEAFVFAAQNYLLRGPGGDFHSATLHWNDALLSDLAAVRKPGRDPVIVQRLGEQLRGFLASTGWPVAEDKIRDAVGKRPVFVTIRSGAAELYVLPWELLTIEASGQHIGELPGVLVRYEWPDTRTRSQSLDSGGSRFLLAWSGQVPALEHQTAIQQACRTGDQPFDPELDVLAHASCSRLSERLQAATDEGRPIRILHLLCHGTATGSTFGLALDGDEPGDAVVAVDAARLRQILAPHVETLRLVVLSACDGGNVGDVGNQLGSVAQALHRIGIAQVVASRFPLSVSGSNRLATMLYQTLVGRGTTLEEAFIAARQHLARDAAQPDWLSLQLYARAEDGNTVPFDRVSAEALRTPQVREELSQFRTLFSTARTQIALLGRYKAFHDALQELEAPFGAIARDHKRLLAAPEAWDELRDPLESVVIALEATLEILKADRLRDEFDVSRRRLDDALAALKAAMAGEIARLDRAVLHIRSVLGRDLSTANNRLVTIARDLGLDTVVTALRAVVANLGPHRTAAVTELIRLVADLEALHTGFGGLVREHDRWQEIGDELRHFVDAGHAGIAETQHAWPIVHESLATVLATTGGAGWVKIVADLAAQLDAALARGDEPCKCVTHLRGLFRRTNQRFVDVDKQLLRTCEELRQVGDKLETVLKVIDE